ncbi:MAG: hypothetical protein IJK40_00990 [Clostridia bacterium]|nr:hypothetical protein [Clostridia bacterium]
MKKLRMILSVLLCLSLLFGSVSAVFAAAAPDEVKQEGAGTYASYDLFANLKTDETQSRSEQAMSRFKQILAKILNLLSNFLINKAIGKPLALTVPAAKTVRQYETFDLDAYGDFYAGTDQFLTEPASDAVWRLGYSEKSIMPADFGIKPYAKGAYLPDVYCTEMYKDDDGEAEELRVRTIVLDDGSGRGSAAFCAVDAMGLANTDVRLIRAALADFAAAHNLVSINVDCTHIHTGIDSQGVWNRPVTHALNNMLKLDVEYGVDRTFLQAVIDGAKASVEEAYAAMTEGTLWYSAVNIGKYVWDRTAPICLDDMLYKLEFVPEDEAVKPTLITTFGCHPESASFDWDSYVDENGKKGFDKKLSADFIWYMEKVANAVGRNFIFIQGDVGTVTSGRGLSNDNGLDTDAHSTAMRYGYEMGYIALGLNMTEEERIALNAETCDRLGIEENADRAGYTKWYDGLPTVAATAVSPLLNIAHRQFFCPIDNNVVAILGKTAIADNLMLRTYLGQFYTVTEVGYMEIGDALKVYLSPGETFTELLKGGSGIAGFPYKAIREVLGENTIVFDLMNDAAGYVANDANFVMAGLQYNENSGELDSDTWCLISYGKRAGSTFIGNFYELVNEKTGG